MQLSVGRLSLIVICSFSVSLTNCSRQLKYEVGVRMMNEEQYSQAQQMFDELSDFKDSKGLVQACKNYQEYNKAVNYMDQKNYEEAAAIFEDLGHFFKSSIKYKECKQLSNF